MHEQPATQECSVAAHSGPEAQVHLSMPAPSLWKVTATTPSIAAAAPLPPASCAAATKRPLTSLASWRRGGNVTQRSRGGSRVVEMRYVTGDAW